ncbi:hypothetical protein [Pacificibacter sp. AS14]|uniref:hypothetical protein n=1 Tax=Pacificibacter sp. AS14 TaxID=3135785 RepID=UPI003175272D
MAFVHKISKDEDREIRSLHPTRLECRYIASESNGMKILQLNSYGSDDRDVPGKLSQTLQFDENSAQELFQVLKAEFGFEG